MTDPDANDATQSVPPNTTIQPQGLRKRVAGGAVWLSIEAFGIQGFTLLIFLILSRFLDATAIGMISVALVLIYSIKALFIENISVAVVREAAPTSADYNTAFLVTVIVSLLLFVGLIEAAGPIERVMGVDGLGSTLIKLSPIIVLMGLFRVQEGWLLRNYQFKQVAIRSLICITTGGAIGTTLAIRHFGIDALIAQQLTMFSLSAIILWSSCGWRPSLASSRAMLSRIGTFSLRSFPGAALSMASQNADVVLVGYFFGVAAAGLYSLAKRLRSAMQTGIMTVLQNLSMPIMVEMQADPSKLGRVALTVSKITVLITAPVFLGLSATSRYVIDVAFGARWAEAAPVLAALAIGGFCMAFSSSNDTLLTIKNRPSLQSAIAALYVVLALALFFLRDHFGITNSAQPFVLPYIVTLPVSLLVTARIIEVSVWSWLRALRGPVVASVLMYGTVLWVGTISLPGPSIYKLIVLVAVGAVSFGCYYKLLEPKEFSEFYRLVAQAVPTVWGRITGLFKTA